MKTNYYTKTALLAMFAIASSLSILAQEKAKNLTDTVKVATPKVGQTTNVMLNASSDNGPRAVNIGLPASVGGTTILENGLPVTYDYMGQMPANVWRNDAGIAKFDVYNVMQTAVLAGDVGVSVSTWTNRGTPKFKGSGTFTTNSYGLLRGDVGVSGPLKNGFSYSFTAFVNMDPGTFRANFSDFLDKTQIYKGVINKKYGSGQIGLQYKYANSMSVTTKQSPYIYHKDGTVTALDNFRIGRDSYIEQSGIANIVDPLTGKERPLDIMKDLGSISHVVDLMGDHKLDNDVKIDYTLRYQYANAGMYNPYLTSISDVQPINSPVEGNRRYFYTDSKAPYYGYVQNGMMIAAPKSVKNTIMGRVEFSKKADKHSWMLGFHNWYYQVDKATMGTYSFQTEVAPNPKALLMEEYVFDKDANGNSIPNTGKWKRQSDKYGNSSYNKAMQYYNGFENKLALIASDKWTLNDKLSIDASGRAEWQRIDGDWYSADNRKAGGTNWVSGETTKIQKDWFNLTGTASATYKAFDHAGFLADAYYIQQSGKLSMYAGADDPAIDQSVIPGASIGGYFNHPLISLVSKATVIKRTNFKNNSTFNKVVNGAVETDKQTITYGVSTIGWTTDMLIKPFKGFDLHLLLTLQNPTYDNYKFTTKWGDVYDFSGNTARSVSKTLIEIDPSYTTGKFKFWGSARYFSQENANYPNTLVFAARWETFAGINYKYDKNVDFSISAVNLLNQSGAQGSISGTNTTTAEEAKRLYDKPLVGTYIRPFTVEFKSRVKF